jgi:hypothetical protein
MLTNVDYDNNKEIDNYIDGAESESFDDLIVESVSTGYFFNKNLREWGNANIDMSHSILKNFVNEWPDSVANSILYRSDQQTTRS